MKFVEGMQMCGGIGAISGASFRPMLPVEPVTQGVELLMAIAKLLVKAKPGASSRPLRRACQAVYAVPRD